MSHTACAFGFFQVVRYNALATIYDYFENITKVLTTLLEVKLYDVEP